MVLNTNRIRTIAAAAGPGILVAATGVGAGDLATATLTGARLGTAILWAVVIGAGLKFVLNEGLARWQLVTGTTLLEGACAHLPRWMLGIFFLYLLVWSTLVSVALMSATGVAAHAMIPLFDDASEAKKYFGLLQSLLAVGLVWLGGYNLFEKVMGICIGVMFVVCCVTACLLAPSLLDIVYGLSVPTIPQFTGQGLSWTIALLGGVGGTVTVLCYGYWIREEGRQGEAEIATCRIDLGIGYAMTAIFGIAMVIIGSQLGDLSGSGATLVVKIADLLQERNTSFGPVMRWAFLIGAWGAVFSSLLGVWQSVPYLFADFVGRYTRSTHPKPRQRSVPEADSVAQVEAPGVETSLQPSECEGIDVDTGVNTSSWLYRGALLAIAILPAPGLWIDFSTAMKFNGLIGAVFIPMLAICLLRLAGNRSLMGTQVNSRATTVLLVATLAMALLAGVFKAKELFS